MGPGMTLNQLEARIRDISLDFDIESMRRAGYQVIDCLVDRIIQLRESPLGQELTREDREKLLRQAMLEHPSDFHHVFGEYVPEGLPKDEASVGMFLNRLNENLASRIIASRKLMLYSTRLGSRSVLRLCVLNHRTREEDVREALRLIEQFGREAAASLFQANRPSS